MYQLYVPRFPIRARVGRDCNSALGHGWRYATPQQRLRASFQGAQTATTRMWHLPASRLPKASARQLNPVAFVRWSTVEVIVVAPERSPKQKQLLQSIFAIKGSTFEKCFWPAGNCPNRAIRAHSVQNATALSLLEEKGHVVAPTIRLDAEHGPVIDLTKVGRNQATTFAGLCGKHDRETFAPIELGELNLQDPEHRFLLAFRATFYEVHATASTGVQIQTAYMKRVELGLDPKGSPSPAGLLATQRLLVAWQTWVYMSHFAEAYAARQFEAVEHDLRFMNVQEPTLASSALVSFDSRKHRDGVRVCITVLPVAERETAVLLSYTPAEAEDAKKQFKKLLKANGDAFKRELTRRLLNHCSNFVLSPSYVASWSPTKRDVVLDLFKRTVFRNDLKFDHPDLNLFL